MTRPFRTFDYDATLTRTFCLADLLPATHPARHLVAWLATLDLAPLYALYTPIGGHPYDPRGLLALWLYAYMTGTASSRQLEAAIGA
ncbi:MAG TPA: IS5/IS1182 family transposase, partial [Armatimonadota bacterium]